MRWLLLFLIAIGLVACGQVATPTQADAPLPQITVVGQVGDRLIVNGEALTVERFERQGSRIVADVTIENVDIPSAPYSPQFFLVRDSEGNTYPADVQSLKVGQLAQGERMQGQVAFGVGDAKDLTLEFKTPLFANTDPLKIALK